jgi:hypothetical protein
MDAPKKRFDNSTANESASTAERRRIARIVHDHKGTASVQWHDVAGGEDRVPLEIEGARQAAQPPDHGPNTGSLTIETQDNHDPYTRMPGAGRPRNTNGRTDLRKLSAWIKLMRQLEESKRNGGED